MFSWRLFWELGDDGAAGSCPAPACNTTSGRTLRGTLSARCGPARSAGGNRGRDPAKPQRLPVSARENDKPGVGVGTSQRVRAERPQSRHRRRHAGQCSEPRPRGSQHLHRGKSLQSPRHGARRPRPTARPFKAQGQGPNPSLGATKGQEIGEQNPTAKQEQGTVRGRRGHNFHTWASHCP